MTVPLLRKSDLTENFVNTNTAGDNTIVAAAPGQTTRVHRLHLTAAAAVNVQIKLGTTVVDQFTLIGTQFIFVLLDFNDRAYYETAVNQALILNLSAAVLVTGTISTITSA